MSDDQSSSGSEGSVHSHGPLSKTEIYKRCTSNLCHYCGGDNHLVASCPRVPKKLEGPLLKEEQVGLVKSSKKDSFGSRTFAGVTLSQTLEHRLYLKLDYITNRDANLGRNTKNFSFDLNMSSG